MTLKNFAARAIATIFVTTTGLAVAGAQVASTFDDRTNSPGYQVPAIGSEPGFPRISANIDKNSMRLDRRDRDPWNALLWISAIVLVVGIADDDGGLIIIGGAGVVVSLVESDQFGGRLAFSHNGVDFLKAGSLSFGLNQTYYQVGQTHGVTYQSPCLQMSFKF
jgi:hypothetical protein